MIISRTLGKKHYTLEAKFKSNWICSQRLHLLQVTRSLIGMNQTNLQYRRNNNKAKKHLDYEKKRKKGPFKQSEKTIYIVRNSSTYLLFSCMNKIFFSTGYFMKKVLLAIWALRNRHIVVFEWVYTETTFMKSAVLYYKNNNLVLWYSSKLVVSISFFVRLIT